jgi:very-long-chain enoyl-CoA reductase
MGPQVPWRTVFVLEYLGPIIIHPIVLLALPYALEAITGQSREKFALNATQQLSFVLIVSHFIKRELETLFVHRFSAATMPAANVMWNSAHYWIPAGLLAALEIYSPWSLAARPVIPAMNWVGVALYLFGQIANFRVHLYLKSLRKPGETEKRLPVGHGFGLVTCPNYMFEVIAWLGAILVCRSVFIVIYMCIGTYYMYTWGVGKEKTYRALFGDRYKKKRYIMLPGFL